MREFYEKAEPKAERILGKYPYCLIDVYDENFNIIKTLKTSDIDEIESLYYQYYDIFIKTPDGNNY